jgi:hypothetical protein
MKGWVVRHWLKVMIFPLLLIIPGLAGGTLLPQNMEFNPPPRVGDTSVSGTCSLTPNCVGMVQVLLVKHGGQSIMNGIMGTGFCSGGTFSINLCNIFDASAPTGCNPYALEPGDVIQAYQSTSEVGGPLCDSTREFALGAGIPTLNQWGMIFLCFLLAFSALLLIRKRRHVRQES